MRPVLPHGPASVTTGEIGRVLNIALKAQLDALERQIGRMKQRPKRAGVGLRAAQVFAYLLTRGDEPFQRYFLSAPLTTVLRWATRFR